MADPGQRLLDRAATTEHPKRRSAPAWPSAPPASTCAAAAASDLPSAVRPTSTDPEQVGELAVRRASNVVRAPPASAPPYRQAATPTPPHANPGRVDTARFADRSRRCPASRTGTLATVPRLASTQGSDGHRSTKVAEGRPRTGDAVADECRHQRVIEAPPSEHHGLRPSRTSRRQTLPLRPPSGTPWKTPRPTALPARIARASGCAPRGCASVRFAAGDPRRTSHRPRIAPRPGRGSLALARGSGRPSRPHGVVRRIGSVRTSAVDRHWCHSVGASGARRRRSRNPDEVRGHGRAVFADQLVALLVSR